MLPERKGAETMFRHRGFVVGLTTGKNPAWKVRVKDERSPYNNRVLVVASIHGDVTLAQGLNVTLIVGSVDDQNKNPVLRAVDVMVEEPSSSS